MSINRVNITGNLTRDPELRATANGTQVLTFGVAVNDRRHNQQTGEWEDVPNFIDCVVFGRRAQSLSNILTKGMKVAIEGKLRYSSWESNGQRRSKIEVIVDEIEFLSRGQGQGGYQSAPQVQAPQDSYQQPSYQGNYNASVPQQQAPVAAAPAPAQQMPPSPDVYDEDIPL
jgi:single-strand DNA-binding protein